MGTVVDTNAPLMSAGLDSIAATEFTSTLSERLGIQIQATALYDHPTLHSLAEYLAEELTSSEPTETAPREEE